MPVFRFGRTIKITPKTRIFLNVEAGAASPKADDTPMQETKSRAARQRARQQRRRLARKGQEEGVRATGGLPDFLIIGAQKSGTTLLYELLGLHPGVEPATTKEVHYLDQRFGEGDEWYRSHFVAQPRGESFLTGEATPYYLFYPHAPARAAGLVPEARLLVLLRNPVDRAFSHYHHMFRRKRETLSFEEAVRAEEFRLRGEVEKILEDERYHSFNHQWFSYLSRGIYVDQISAWQNHFDARQMLVLKSEDLFTDTPATMKTVLRFLGLANWESERWERPAKSGGYPPMNPSIRRRLERYFEPHNQRLYKHLGVDFGW